MESLPAGNSYRQRRQKEPQELVPPHVIGRIVQILDWFEASASRGYGLILIPPASLRTSTLASAVLRHQFKCIEGEATIRLRPLGSHATVQRRLRITRDGQDYHASVTVNGQKLFERDWSSGLFRAIGSEDLTAQVGETVHYGGGGRVEIHER